jgi:hypothetical protein
MKVMIMARMNKRSRNAAMRRMRMGGSAPMKPMASRPHANPAAESEIAAARAALRDAARTLSVLARDEPRFYPKGPQEPRPPLSPGRVVHVFPTSHHKLDVENLEKAIIDAGPGGTVMLRAADRSGKLRHFDLSKVDELFMEHEVTLKSEKNAVIKLRV